MTRIWLINAGPLGMERFVPCRRPTIKQNALYEFQQYQLVNTNLPTSSAFYDGVPSSRHGAPSSTVIVVS